MSGAAFGGEGEEGDAGAYAQEQAGQLGGGDGNVGKLLDGGFGDDAAIGHEKNPIVPKTGVFDLHDHATGNGGGFRGDFDDLKEGAEDAAGALIGPGDIAVGLMDARASWRRSNWD